MTTPKLEWKFKELDGNICAASFNGIDIFIITELNGPLRGYSGYRLDTDLVIQQKLELTPFLQIPKESDSSKHFDSENFAQSTDFCSITCNGYHSDTLALGDDAGRLQLIDTRRPHEAKRISYQRDDMITDISIDPKFILAGTQNGFLGLWDYEGDRKFEFQAEGYIHSVSIHGNRILAATNNNVYIWKLDTARCYKYATNRGHLVAWACFHPFQRGLSPFQTLFKHPYLVASFGRSFTWRNKLKGLIGLTSWRCKFRPMIREVYGPDDREYSLVVTGKEGKTLEVHDLKSGNIIRRIAIKEAPEMLWTNEKYLFLVYWDSNRVESARLFSRYSTVGVTYYESVSLRSIFP